MTMPEGQYIIKHDGEDVRLRFSTASAKSLIAGTQMIAFWDVRTQMWLKVGQFTDDGFTIWPPCSDMPYTELVRGALEHLEDAFRYGDIPVDNHTRVSMREQTGHVVRQTEDFNIMKRKREIENSVLPAGYEEHLQKLEAAAHNQEHTGV